MLLSKVFIKIYFDDDALVYIKEQETCGKSISLLTSLPMFGEIFTRKKMLFIKQMKAEITRNLTFEKI